MFDLLRGQAVGGELGNGPARDDGPEEGSSLANRPRRDRQPQGSKGFLRPFDFRRAGRARIQNESSRRPRRPNNRHRRLSRGDVEDRRACWNDNEIGQAGGLAGKGRGARRGIDHGDGHPVVPGHVEKLAQFGAVNRHNQWSVRLPRRLPDAGRPLLVRVADGQMNGQGRFPAAALLGEEGDGFHAHGPTTMAQTGICVNTQLLQCVTRLCSAPDRKKIRGGPVGLNLAYSACANPKGRDYTLAMAQTSNVVYDTHAAVRRLTGSGMPEPHAEAVVREQVHLIEHNLATKADIETLRQETKADIAAVRADIEKLRLETRAGIETLRQETKADIAAVRADIEKLRLETRAGIETLRQELSLIHI